MSDRPIRVDVGLCPTHRWTTEIHRGRCGVRDKNGERCGARFSHQYDFLPLHEHDEALTDARAAAFTPHSTASTQPPSPQAEVQDCETCEGSERVPVAPVQIGHIVDHRDGLTKPCPECTGKQPPAEREIDQPNEQGVTPIDEAVVSEMARAQAVEHYLDEAREPSIPPHLKDQGTGKQPPAEPQGDVVEKLAKLLSRLYTTAGEEPEETWDQHTENLRDEWRGDARSVLGAITPLLALEVKERLEGLREKLALLHTGAKRKVDRGPGPRDEGFHAERRGRLFGLSDALRVTDDALAAFPSTDSEGQD